MNESNKVITSDNLAFFQARDYKIDGKASMTFMKPLLSNLSDVVQNFTNDLDEKEHYKNEDVLLKVSG